jgi:hypothetical protein
MYSTLFHLEGPGQKSGPKNLELSLFFELGID